MSMYNDIEWRKTRKQRKMYCECPTELQSMLEDSREGHWSFLGPGSEKKWHGTPAHLRRGELKSKGKGIKSMHFNGSDDTIELILRTSISVNQLRFYGAVADLCGELARDSQGTEKPAANEKLESMVIPTEFPAANPIAQTDAEVQGNLLREYERKFVELPEHEKLTKLCSTAGFSKNIEKGQFFITLVDDALDDLKGSCREYSFYVEVRGWIRGNSKIGPVLDVKVCYHQGTLRCGDHDRILIS